MQTYNNLFKTPEEKNVLISLINHLVFETDFRIDLKLKNKL